MFEIIGKTILIYFLMLITLRFMGKREIGELSTFDFVVILLIADVAAIIIDEDYSVWFCIVPVLVLAFIQKLIAFLSLKFNFIRNIVDGKRSIIIYENKLNIKEMKKQNYNMEDLLMQLRQKDVFSLIYVDYLFLETDGQVSVITNPEDKNSIKYVKEEVFPVIISGKIVKENLMYLQKSSVEIESLVKKKGYTVNNIFYACLINDDLFIMKTCNLEDSNETNKDKKRNKRR